VASQAGYGLVATLHNFVTEFIENLCKAVTSPAGLLRYFRARLLLRWNNRRFI